MSFLGNAFTQEVWSDHSRILPDLLRKVPVAIQMWHTNNPNYPEKAAGIVETDAKYVWRHSTSVTSMDSDLQVLSAGSFIWYSREGWQKNLVYSKEEFSKYFQCPGGVLKKGKTYTFEQNFRFDNQLYGGDALWYVIAEDPNGKRYKGMAIIETESEVNH